MAAANVALLHTDLTGRRRLADGPADRQRSEELIRDEDALKIVMIRGSRSADATRDGSANAELRALAVGHASKADYVVTGVYSLLDDSVLAGVRIVDVQAAQVARTSGTDQRCRFSFDDVDDGRPRGGSSIPWPIAQATRGHPVTGDDPTSSAA
jgi:hypothetical protein